MNTTDKLIQLKEEIDQAASNIERLTGKKESLTDQLKKDWECTTIKQATKKAGDIEKQIAEMDAQIEKNVTKLSEKYEL